MREPVTAPGPRRLDASAPGFEAAFRDLLGAKREVSEDVDVAVARIIADVVARGDDALIDASARLDRVDLRRLGLRVTPPEIAAAVRAAPAEPLAALRLAHRRILAFHEAQRPLDRRWTDPEGVELGWRWSAVEAVGLYVPGGTASYPSSVLMNAVPAKVAGCRRIVMVVPTPDGVLNPLVLAAADLAGVDEIYRVGGAQAIAALAFGTETIAPVGKIVGPGNAYVAAAKRRVFGTVGIDMIAGPSEIVVLADGSANPDWIAADLLAQAEHDTAAQSILITDDEALALAVEAAVAGQLGGLPRAEIAGASWRDFGAILKVPDLAGAVPLVDRLAPEHLEIMARDAEAIADLVRNAGAIFIGGHTPEAIGDYVGGSNHVLPTARSARFASGLGVQDFVKRTSILKCSAEALMRLAPAAIALGRAEGTRGPCPFCGDPDQSGTRRVTRASGPHRLVGVTLDEASIGRGSPDQEHERRIAIFDLVEDNHFALPSHAGGPYRLHIGMQDGKLLLAIATETHEPIMSHILSLKPLRSLVKDYLMLCDHYYAAIRSATPNQIEAIDMGRRGLHDEGAERLGERLKGKIECDPDTLRRLFTLVTALHWKG